MAVKKQPHKKSGKGASSSGSKQFQLVNGVITKEDITPLAKSSQHSTASSDDESSTSTTMESDLLFSPMGSAVDDAEDEDEYDHELLSPVYFGATYPKRFHHVSNAYYDDGAVESRKGSVCGQFLKDLLGNTTNEDFWKEVGTTSEEAIFASQPLEPPVESPSVQDQSITSLDEYIREDATAPASSALSAAQWDDNYKIKLLCYRDTTGNLRLRTQEESCSGSRSLLVGSNHKVNKIRRGKGKSKLLKNAIRRKSGVREMVSTGVGIGEFML
ncbi:hypothetical protein HG536_0B01810 [Torulaspora globosa]|uniref:Uncharacterized protein n=1 Tax=Torulaspora globosa TaxID=48254 RepID=A0A7G3ZCT2_9SACH|nr:uncharacterized protein HG536_0B01810 [Torulaspora globosa]QLL31318.1 hypothetical protein HG536_0B01810 [Torulaspora globosa]